MAFNFLYNSCLSRVYHPCPGALKRTEEGGKNNQAGEAVLT